MAALAKVVAIMIASMAILATVAGGATPVIGPTPVVGGGTTQIPAEGGASWCVARSDASEQGLQTALDYACGSGADCTPIQTSGLCYLPNTLQAHASYAFNSFFQRKSMAPGSCDFAGTANIARTDPSYGSCVYPSSLSTAGGMSTPASTPSTPGVIYPPPSPISSTPLAGISGGYNPGLGPTVPTTNNSVTSMKLSVFSILMHISFFLALLFTFQPMLVF
ncbi:hypothetical protein VitviT2T_007026 [Vitis vinifera]|uniref:X8 domain-containing protein n=2 Tax=Vitis vinifera TaxID=29760 RepID=A0ABY9BYG5_VITVI|eukprot:XP_002267551.1 PREDICTED: PLASMODESMATA CALLOSE-BINDING PROTEIN 3 isoform X1 [Vitis vinifera]